MSSSPCWRRPWVTVSQASPSAARAGQGGAERVAQRGQAVVNRPGAAFHQPVSVDGEAGPRRQADPGGLERLGAEAQRQPGRQFEHPGHAAGQDEHGRKVPRLGDQA